MDEFIREVDEEYRRERIAEIWRRYSAVIVGAAVLIVAAVGGWRYWEHVELQRSEAASIGYDSGLRLARDGQADASLGDFSALAKDGPAGYRLLARFRLAAETGRQNPETGAAAYDALAEDSTLDPAMRDLARLRAALLRLDLPDGAGQAAQALERLASPTNPWRHTARELLGLAALKKGEADGASRWFDQIAQDRDTPQALRGRLEIYTALAAGGSVQITQ